MANRFSTPNVQFFTNPVTGAPLAGGKLSFFATGSSTPLNTYSDSALTIANTNPVILDSNGFAGNIFLQNAGYKVVLADSNNVQVWTADPVWTSDFSAIAQVQVINGNPNGQLAGTAGTFGGLPSSMAWDATNNILYVCTTSGSSVSAVWTAVNAGSATPIVPPPGGRLTLVSGTPVMASDQVSQSSVFYDPYNGQNTCPIFSGTSFTVTSFSEQTLGMTAGKQLASTLYDIFMFSNSGVATLCFGPAWQNSTAGSCSRGTGAGTTQISYLQGVLINTVQIAANNGATSFSIPANQATYLGTLLVDTVAGQVTCHFSYGQSRRFGLWNYYNRVPIYLKAGDPTASWTYALATIRAANAAAANSLTVLQGVAEEDYTFEHTTVGTNLGAGSATVPSATAGIGFNLTTAYSGRVGTLFPVNVTGGSPGGSDMVARFFTGPTLGINTITALEAAPGASTTFQGTEARMLLTARWNG